MIEVMSIEDRQATLRLNHIDVEHMRDYYNRDNMLPVLRHDGLV